MFIFFWWNILLLISLEWWGWLTWNKMEIHWMDVRSCVLKLSPHSWSWPWIFKVKFWISCSSGMEGPFDILIEWKGCDLIWWWTHFVTLSHDLDLGYFYGQILKKHIPGMGWPIDMEQKGCDSIGRWTHFVTWSYNIDLGFSMSNFQITISHEWEGW